MIKKGLLVKLIAKPGKEQAVAAFLQSAVPLLTAEPNTINWYAFKIDDSTFGIFDTFVDEAGRNEHLGGKIAEALMANAPELLVSEPVIELVDLLAHQ